MLSALRHLKMREKFTLLCVYFFAGYAVFGVFLYRAVGASAQGTDPSISLAFIVGGAILLVGIALRILSRVEHRPSPRAIHRQAAR